MKVHLITNCSSGKSSKLGKKVQIKSICNENHSPSKAWLELLKRKKNLLEAIDVYVGDHWSQVKDVFNANIPVWVVSAGYGFISAKEKITSYDATFNGNHENSVSRFFYGSTLAEKNSIWWDQINDTNSLSSAGPIERLYKSNESDVFFIVVPPNYLKVLEPELKKLVASGVINDKNTFIISSKQNLEPSLKEFFFQSKDNLCKKLKGSRISLNIRLANYVIKRLETQRDISSQVKSIYKGLFEELPPAEKFNRKKMTDEDVFQFLRGELQSRNDKFPSASYLLRVLRDNGMACEQKRFGKIYKEFIELK